MLLEILENRATQVKQLIQARLQQLVAEKLEAKKQELGASLTTEANVLRQGRTLLIRRRIRKGKLQRNIRKSAIKGFTLKRKKLVRIPATKRIRMRIVQRRAARKRKAKLSTSLRKRKLSLRKRKNMGIKE